MLNLCLTLTQINHYDTMEKGNEEQEKDGDEKKGERSKSLPSALLRNRRKG